jgi:two-component system NarL family sensor kinase
MIDNYLIPFFLAGAILFTVFTFFLVAFLLIHRNKQNAYLIEKEKMIFDHENSLLQTRIEEQERTMTQVSKSVHDDLRQGLNFLQMNIKFLTRYIHEPEANTVINTINNVVSELMNNAHNISHFLSSDYIKGRGLLDVLQDELKYISDANNIICKVNVTGDYQTFNTNVELLIYRIVQEGINNILKHAQATKIEVDLEYQFDSFLITIKDNGIGFEKDKISSFDGLGFFNMFQRAKYLNAILDIESNITQGSVITLQVENISKISY